MSYAIVRVEKYTSGKIGGIQIHDRRLKEGVSHTNKNIDWEKTYLNYNLAETKNENFHKDIKGKIKSLNLKRAVRKDAIVMVQCLVTSDKTFFDSLGEEKTKCFFKDSYAWLCKRYGKENIVSAIVHMDEKTPHMHFNFVPITEDGRLSAKSIITRQSLIEQQDNFIKDVGNHYGLERGREGSNAEHLDVAEYKINTKSSELKKLEEKRELVQAHLNVLEGSIKAFDEIRLIQPKQTLGGLKNITIDDIEKLKRMALELLDARNRIGMLQLNINELERRNKEVQRSDKELSRLTKKYRELKRKFEKMDSIINSNVELKQIFVTTSEKHEESISKQLAKITSTFTHTKLNLRTK